MVGLKEKIKEILEFSLQFLLKNIMKIQLIVLIVFFISKKKKFKFNLAKESRIKKIGGASLFGGEKPDLGSALQNRVYFTLSLFSLTY